MDIAQAVIHKQDSHILKSNLWKFMKALRAQANPIYCLLVASPISMAWITIIDRLDSTSQKRISVSQFVNALKKMPSEDKHYQLSISLWSELQGKYLFEAAHLSTLSVETMREIFPAMIGCLCADAAQREERFELTPPIIQHYKFKARYIEEINAIVEQCNIATTLKSKHK